VNDELLRPVGVPMKDKFLKYWRKIPMLYAFAFVLDPRAKLKGLHNILCLLSNHMVQITPGCQLRCEVS
jgi:hypothetical protein